MNIAGIIPGLNIAASSVVAVPMVFAPMTYVTFIGAGISEAGHRRVSSPPSSCPPGLPEADVRAHHAHRVPVELRRSAGDADPASAVQHGLRATCCWA